MPLTVASHKITAHQRDWQVLGWKVDGQTGKTAKPALTSFPVSPEENVFTENCRKMTDGRLKLTRYNISLLLRWSRIIFFGHTNSTNQTKIKLFTQNYTQITQNWELDAMASPSDCHQHKMVVLISRMFGLHFGGVGQSGDCVMNFI